MKRKPKVDMPRQNMEPKMFFFYGIEKREYLMGVRDKEESSLASLSLLSSLRKGAQGM